MKVHEIRNIEKFKEIKPDWDEALERSPNNTLYLTHEWLSTWWEHFGQDREMLVLIASDEGRIIAGMPLFIATKKLMSMRCRVVEQIGHSISTRSEVLLTTKPEESLRMLLSHLLAIRREWDIIRLNDLPEDSSASPYLDQILREMRLPFDIIAGAASPYIRLNGDLESYMASRSRSLIKDIRRQVRRLRSKHDLRITYHRGGNTEWLMEKVMEIESRSWKHENGTSILSDPAETSFFLDLARVLGDRGWLRISIMDVDCQPAAYCFDAAYNGALFGIKCSFDNAFARRSPGKILMKHVIENASKEGLEEIDMGGQNDSYKMRWTDNIRRHRNITVFNPHSWTVVLYARTLLRKIKLLRRSKDKFVEFLEMIR